MRSRTIFAVLALLGVAAVRGGAQDVKVPPPRGMLSDFADVIDAAHAERITRIAEYVRAKCGGEIAVVTLSDIGQHDPGDVALQIGRQWGVGANAPVGDRRRNTGVVVLMVPKESSSDGHGKIAVTTGQGSEGFLTDAIAGDIRREATPLLAAHDYGGGLELITHRLAEHYAREFGFSLDSMGVAAPSTRTQTTNRGPSIPFGAYVFVFVILFFVLPGLARAGRRGGLGGALPWIILSAMSQGRRRGGGWGGGGGFGGFGGGGGGGFGGFGGGGGFSGGGSSGSF